VTFLVGHRMAACVCGDVIALKLPQLSLAALMEASGCTYFCPFGRHPMPRWLAFGASSPASASLDDLFNEAVSFAKELAANDGRPGKR
jgi:hypothetical protein